MAGETIHDVLNRTLVVEEPDTISESRLVRQLGSAAAMNQAYMLGYVMPASCVKQINELPFTFPQSQAEVDVLITQLGREGIAAVMDWLMRKQEVAASARGAVIEGAKN